MQVPHTYPSAAPEVMLILLIQYISASISMETTVAACISVGWQQVCLTLSWTTVLCSSLTKGMVLCIDFDCCVASFALQEASGSRCCLDLTLVPPVSFGSAVVKVIAIIVLCNIASVIFPWSAWEPNAHLSVSSWTLNVIFLSSHHKIQVCRFKVGLKWNLKSEQAKLLNIV